MEEHTYEIDGHATPTIHQLQDEMQLQGALAMLTNPAAAGARALFAEYAKREMKEERRKSRRGSEETQKEKQRLAQEKRARKLAKRALHS